MIAQARLALALLAAWTGAALCAEPPATPDPRYPSNQPPPPRAVLPPPSPQAASDIAGPGLKAFLIPPQAEYPVEALRNDLSGRCMITFTVGADGAPQDIVPDCTDPVFTAAARNAVAAARVRMDGEIKPGAVLRLPLRFQTADWDTPEE